MRVRTLIAALLLPSLAACAAGSGGGGGGAPAALAYSVPSDPTVTYEIADTAVIAVDAMGQSIEIPAISSQTVTMTFSSAADGDVLVNADWSAYEATMSNPMGPAERGSLQDIDGTLTFELAPGGEVTVIELPRVRGTTESLFTPGAMANTFFPRLPVSAPTAGMSWTDTIAYMTEQGGTVTDASSILTYTVVGDVEMNGASYLRVDYEGSEELTQEGSQMGMSFTQLAQGTTEGHFLWDQATGVMHRNVYSSRLDGTMEMDQMPTPLPISVASRSVVTRTSGPGGM